MANKIKLLGNLMRTGVRNFLTEYPFRPLFVHFDCTYRCNMKCSFCNVWRKKTHPDEASASEFKQKLSEYWDLGCSVISYTGGEPLLRKDIGELLEFSSRKIGFYTGLVTNGLLLDKRINEISKYTDFLAVSFDVNDKETFNKTRGVDAFERVKKNIELVRRMGIEINLFSVMTKETFRFIDETVDFAKSLKLPVHFSPVDIVPRDFLEKSDVGKLRIGDTGEILKKLADAKKKYRKVHFEKDYLEFQVLGGFNRFIGCSSASTTISLKPDATVALPCPFFTLMTIEKNESIRNRLNSAEARRIIKECGRWHFCRNCSIGCMYVVSLLNHPYFLMRWIRSKL